MPANAAIPRTADPPTPTRGLVTAPPGTTFQGASQSDVTSLLSELNRLAPPAREAFIELQKTLERYERMSPVVEDTLREFRDQLQTEFHVDLAQLSMGMTQDFAIAVEEGATLVRVGTAIFGERSKRQKD